MDSRLKKQVIAAAVTMVAVVIVMVLVANEIKNDRSPKPEVVETIETTTAKEKAPYDLDPDKDPYAYLGDDEFFDPVVEHADPAVTLSILVSSVEKDLRVKVVNGHGELVTDQAFAVQVAQLNGKTSTYKDADKDGCIYIAPAIPGDYELTLQPVEGYVLAQEAVPITVKEQIEYTVIDDISFMIKTDDEIDAKVEDTAINDAELNADGTESNKRLEDDDALFGIDVSKWNKDIDWEAVAASGVDFAIIRCGYRGSKTGALVEDPYFRQNIEEAQAAGIKVGV